MPREVRLKRSFQALDANRRVRTIHVFVQIYRAGAVDDPEAEVQGMRMLRTSEGQNVNRVEPGVYQIAGTNEMLRAIGPDAP